jgi:glutathione S-transferase
MAVEIFWASGSPYSWRVLLAAEFKGIAYESRLLSFSKGETRSPEYTALNPRQRVPALRDGDVVVRESLAILAYLDRKFPERPILGGSAATAGAIFQSICEFGSYMDHSLDSFTQPLYFGGASDKAEQIRAAASTLAEELRTLEATLGTRDSVAPGGLSAADFVWFPGIKSLERASGKEAAAPFELPFLPLEKTHPNIARWMRTVEAIPGYDRTYPPHWRG